MNENAGSLEDKVAAMDIKNPRPEKLELGTLGTDIQALIVDHVSRPTDLRSLCLVNKQFHELAAKPLYRNVAFDLGSSHDNRLSAFLHPSNKGLKHIRTLRLYRGRSHERNHERGNQSSQITFATRMLLEFIPEDTLEEFRCESRQNWCPWEKFSADNLLLLYRKQRRLKWLEVIDLDRKILPELKKMPKLQENVFKHARKLALYPENRETLDLCRFYVQNTADTLEELIIHANLDRFDMFERVIIHHNDIESRELNDTATMPGLVTRTVFGHLMPFDKCTPFKHLTSITLHRVSLRYCMDSWCKFVNFVELQQLRLYQCPGVDALFGQLCRSSYLPRELKVLEVQHKDNQDNETLLALDGFLCLVSGIIDLTIDFENVRSLPAAAGIIRHNKTLEMLNVHASKDGLDHQGPQLGGIDSRELVYDTEKFDKICRACTHLEQLSCAWPTTNILRPPTETYKSFENSSRRLRNLVTLHITTWPTVTKAGAPALPRFIYDQLLRGIAQRKFKLAVGWPPSSPPLRPPSPTPSNSSASTVADNNHNHSASDSEDPTPEPTPSQLRLIAFGISDKIYEREETKNQKIYLRSTALNASAQPKVHATPITWCLRQFVEPRSEVLDFSFGRETRPPCRDREPSTWTGVDDVDEIVVLPGPPMPAPVGVPVPLLDFE